MDANFVRGKNIYDYLIKNSHKASKIFLHENKGLCAEYVRTISSGICPPALNIKYIAAHLDDF